MSVDGTILDATDLGSMRIMLDSDEVEEIGVRLVPLIVGGNDARSLTGLPEGFLPQERHFRLMDMEENEGVLHCRYVRVRKRKDNA